jgi:Ca2+ transporting ATPase
MMLVYAICLSMALHFALLYIPFLQGLFSIVPLDWSEWQAVLWISAPIIVIDEILKAVERAWFLQTMPVIEEKKVKKEANGSANGHVKHE